MAKKYYKAPIHQVGTIITTKTAFGSHSDMIVDMSNYKSVQLGENEVICKDDKGFYVTSKNRIDSGLADPNRYSSTKARILLEQAQESST
jgi:hypothetical protein